MQIRQVTSRAAGAAFMLIAVTTLSACSSQGPKPDDAIVRAKTAVDQAVTAGSAQYAAADLNSAQTKLQTATADQNKGDYKQARSQAEESQVDAELALAKTQAAKADESAKQVRQGNQALQNQVNQPINPPQQ